MRLYHGRCACYEKEKSNFKLGCRHGLQGPSRVVSSDGGRNAWQKVGSDGEGDDRRCRLASLNYDSGHDELKRQEKKKDPKILANLMDE